VEELSPVKYYAVSLQSPHTSHLSACTVLRLHGGKRAALMCGVIPYLVESLNIYVYQFPHYMLYDQ
jgi:hypothetical protein